LIRHGAKFRREVLITAEMIEEFAELTGDANPIHLDAEAAQKRGFKGRVVQGMLLLALVGSLFPEDLKDLPILRELKGFKLSSPVYVGQVVEITGEVVGLSELGGMRRAEIRVTVFNRDENKTAARGMLTILI